MQKILPAKSKNFALKIWHLKISYTLCIHEKHYPDHIWSSIFKIQSCNINTVCNISWKHWENTSCACFSISDSQTCITRSPLQKQPFNTVKIFLYKVQSGLNLRQWKMEEVALIFKWLFNRGDHKGQLVWLNSFVYIF